LYSSAAAFATRLTAAQTLRGVIWTHKSQLKVDFAYSKSDTKILLKNFSHYDVDKNRYGDIDKIEGSVLGKIGKLDSDNTPECQYDGRLGCTADSHETVEIDSYEIRLCKRHIRKLDRERAADQRGAFTAICLIHHCQLRRSILLRWSDDISTLQTRLAVDDLMFA
jgi:hypothetical protein